MLDIVFSHVLTTAGLAWKLKMFVERVQLPNFSTSFGKPACLIAFSFSHFYWGIGFDNAKTTFSYSSISRSCYDFWIPRPVLQVFPMFLEVLDSEKMVVQSFLSKPLLIDGYKWDMRVFELNMKQHGTRNAIRMAILIS